MRAAGLLRSSRFCSSVEAPRRPLQDPRRQIYEELRALGKPDLTSIVIYKTGNQQGYPPFFSDGGEARSKRFNPNNLKQVERWQKEVARVFEEWAPQEK
jgi:hypothetical protein